MVEHCLGMGDHRLGIVDFKQWLTFNHCLGMVEFKLSLTTLNHGGPLLSHGLILLTLVNRGFLWLHHG